MSWRGNWGGPRQTRKRYDNEFNRLTNALIEEPERYQKLYQPTSRGVAAELGISQSAFHRYNAGGSVPAVILAHLMMLTELQKPSKVYWDWVEMFRIELVLSYDHETRRPVDRYRFDLKDGDRNFFFDTPKFSISAFYKVRELLFLNTGGGGEEPLVLAPLTRHEWRAIYRAALGGGYIGEKFKASQERRAANAENH